MAALNRSRRARRALTLAVSLSAVVGSATTSLETPLAAPSRSELRAAEERLLELERDFQLVVERYNLLNEKLSSIHNEISSTELVVRELQSRLHTNEGAAVALATELYKSGSSVALEAVLSAHSLADVEDRLHYLRSSERARSQVFERLATNKVLLDAKVDALEKAGARAALARTTLAELRAEIDAKVVEQRAEIETLNAAIERAERRREAREAAAAAAAAATSSTRAVSTAATEAAAALPARAATAIRAALSQVGKPYRWGAAGPDSYDCSGLTMWAWAEAGVALPHNSGMQYEATHRVSRSYWKPGDLLFFGDPIHHVGMYIGDGKMVEAPYTGTVVRVSSAVRSDYVGAGRPGA